MGPQGGVLPEPDSVLPAGHEALPVERAATALSPSQGLKDRSEASERHAQELRRRMAAAAAALAATEDEIARVHDALASARPGDCDELRRIAADARKAAYRARQIEHQFSD
jgi:hypothetical protein